jgi:hypothetical protein
LERCVVSSEFMGENGNISWTGMQDALMEAVTAWEQEQQQMVLKAKLRQEVEATERAKQEWMERTRQELAAQIASAAGSAAGSVEELASRLADVRTAEEMEL